MFRSIIVVTAVAAITATACVPPAPGSDGVQELGTVVRQQRIGILDSQLNTCNGESVHLAGDIHIVITEHHSVRQGHVNGHLTGTGSAGNDYLLNLQARTTVPPGTEAVEVTVRQLLISKGGAPNQLTIASISSDPFSISLQSDCRG